MKTTHLVDLDGDLLTLLNLVVAFLTYLWNFHPEFWGRFIQFDLRIFFRMGLKPPTSHGKLRSAWKCRMPWMSQLSEVSNGDRIPMGYFTL